MPNLWIRWKDFLCMQKEIVNGGENLQVCTCIMHITRYAAPSAWLFKDAANSEAAGEGAPTGSPAKIFMNMNVIYKIKNVEIIKIDEKQKTSNCKRCLPFCRTFWTCITGSISTSSGWGTGSIWELQKDSWFNLFLYKTFWKLLNRDVLIIHWIHPDMKCLLSLLENYLYNCEDTEGLLSSLGDVFIEPRNSQE